MVRGELIQVQDADEGKRSDALDGAGFDRVFRYPWFLSPRVCFHAAQAPRSRRRPRGLARAAQGPRAGRSAALGRRWRSSSSTSLTSVAPGITPIISRAGI